MYKNVGTPKTLFSLIILVNDFSDDNTLEKSQKIFESNKNFKIVDNRVKGLGGAINLGIKESQGKKISIMLEEIKFDYKVTEVNLSNGEQHFTGIVNYNQQKYHHFIVTIIKQLGASAMKMQFPYLENLKPSQ